MSTRARFWRLRRGVKRAAAALLARIGRWYLERWPLTMRHSYDFGPDGRDIGAALDNPAAWDALRSTESAFGLPGERQAWERSADRADLRQRAVAIAEIARRLGARCVCSYGVGGGSLELNLHRAAPELELICTEYAPRTVEVLRAVFPEATVLQHDLLANDPVAADLHLLHRLDTEFSNAQWPDVFAKFHDPVLVVGGTLLDWDRLVMELRTRRLGGATTAGWTRTPAALRRLWRQTHTAEELPVGELPGYLLTRRAEAA